MFTAFFVLAQYQEKQNRSRKIKENRDQAQKLGVKQKV